MTVINPGSGGGGAANYTNVFGDGSDGAVVLDGATTFNSFSGLAASVYTLTRDLLCSSLTVNGGVTLVCTGFRVFCTGTVTNNGTVHANGPNAVGAVAGAGNNNILAAASGGNGGVNAGTAGNFGGWGGGNAGAGGAGGTGAGGGARNTSASTVMLRSPAPLLIGALANQSSMQSVWGGSGGGGGGGDTTNSGGGGGAGGAACAIFAHAVVNAGAINAKGGNGANGVAGNAGGGSGGGGGLVAIYSLSAMTGAGTTSAAQGTAGAGIGTGATANASTAGSVLQVVLT